MAVLDLEAAARERAAAERRERLAVLGRPVRVAVIGWRMAQRLESLFAGLQVELTFLCGHAYTAEVRWRPPRTWTVLEPLPCPGRSPEHPR